MNRTVLQALAMLMLTAAITFTAAEWRWEPANAAHALAVVETGSPVAINDMGYGPTRQQGHALAAQMRPDLH
jgi:hypothetical protein